MDFGNFIFPIIFLFPFLSVILGAFGSYFAHNIYLAPLCIAIVSIIAAFTLFDVTFLFWALLYVVLAFLSGAVVKYLFFN